MQQFENNEQKNDAQMQMPSDPAAPTDIPSQAYYGGNPPFIPINTYEEPPTPTLTDNLFAWISLFVGYLVVQSFPIVSHTLGGVLCAWMLFLFCSIYLIRSGILPSRSSILFGVTVCLLSLGWITGANHTVQRLLAIFVLFSLFYYIYAACGLCGKQIFGRQSLMHAFYATLMIPMTSLTHLFRALPVRTTHGAGRVMRAVAWALLGLGIAIVPTAVIILLLSYDEQFLELLRRIFSFTPKNVVGTLLDLILGFLVAVLLFGVMFGSKWKRERNGGEETKINAPSCHILPKPLLCAAVTPILAVYVIFFVSQLDWYLSAFTGVLPSNLTYATYARDGFFELCIVCGINALILLLFNLLIRRTEGERGILRAIYSAILSVFTLVLIATAISKMVLYINTYGLTQKRVYASWFMLLLAACFIAVLVAQFARRIRLIALLLVICIVFFGILVLVDIDGVIANYNVDAYLSERVEDVDVETLEDYGVASVPALVSLERELDGRTDRTSQEDALLLRTREVLDRIALELESVSDSFFDFNLPTHRAKRLLAQRVQ